MKKIYIVTILVSVLFLSCRRDADKLEFLGPAYITPEEPLQISSDPVDFGMPVYFTAALYKSKAWIITITGSTSGATKVLNGSSQKITSSNASWDGSSDNALFFRAESCQAVLSFPDTTLTQSVNFTIAVPKTHPGYLISDFETVSFGTYMGSNTGTYFDTPDQATSTIDLYTFSPSPQGSKVLRFDCNDVDADYYTGGVYHNSVAANYGIPAMNSDELYLNLLIYGYSGGRAGISIEVKESDGDNWQPAQIPINWIGWKLVSLKYSQMSSSASTGNVTREANKINSVNISMNSVPDPGYNCKALVDYVIFTSGTPLQP
jgi:hypothetical protein